MHCVYAGRFKPLVIFLRLTPLFSSLLICISAAHPCTLCNTQHHTQNHIQHSNQHCKTTIKKHQCKSNPPSKSQGSEAATANQIKNMTAQHGSTVLADAWTSSDDRCPMLVVSATAGAEFGQGASQKQNNGPVRRQHPRSSNCVRGYSDVKPRLSQG